MKYQSISRAASRHSVHFAAGLIGNTLSFAESGEGDAEHGGEIIAGKLEFVAAFAVSVLALEAQVFLLR
jgi:hypothetical protein